jgi:2-polyprenyl-6-methoxyphenol hydroxylase-like FAD-dependent oxidoreductase
MTEQNYDVAIVGGSIAGCTDAMPFARSGRSVAPIESHPDPVAYKKALHDVHPSQCRPIDPTTGT